MKKGVKKMRKRRMWKCLVMMLSCVALALSLGGCNFFEEEVSEETVHISVMWDGLAYLDAEDQENNAVGNKIREEIGVDVEVTFINGSEAENLTRTFAAGENFPDVIMCPYWGGSDASSAAIREAAKAGYLLDLDALIEEYDCENLETAFEQGVSSDFVEYELGAEEFGGKHYILPMHTPYSMEEAKNFGYTVYCRKDILEDLGVQPESITSSQAVYDLAKKIEAGNYKDINGNKIITASTWGNGWSYECYLNSFKTRGFTNLVKENDTYIWNAMSENLDAEVAFMNEFVNSGLFDISAFSQNSTQALQKHVVGGVGLTAATYEHIYESLAGNLYKTNPEMRYVPLGPILDANGNAAMPDTIQDDGRYGFAVLIITNECKNPEAVMKYLDYINSEEGKRLVYLGIEGEDWDFVENEEGEQVPQMTEQYFAETEKNYDYKYTRGINSIYTLGVSRVHWNELSYAMNEGGEDIYYTQVKEMYPVQSYTGTRANNFDDDYPEIDALRNRLAALDYSTIVTQMYTAPDTASALEKLEQYREKLDKENVLSDYLTWISKTIQEQEDSGRQILY